MTPEAIGPPPFRSGCRPRRSAAAFPLDGDLWGPKHGVETYPTTWYVGREGRVAFKNSGWSQKLAEESGWRVEALKGGTPAADSGGR